MLTALSVPSVTGPWWGTAVCRPGPVCTSFILPSPKSCVAHQLLFCPLFGSEPIVTLYQLSGWEWCTTRRCRAASSPTACSTHRARWSAQRRLNASNRHEDTTTSDAQITTTRQNSREVEICLRECPLRRECAAGSGGGEKGSIR